MYAKLINSYAKCIIGVCKMNGKVQFGENWVKVNDSIFYTTPYGVQVLKAWYGRKKRYDIDAPEEYIIETLEYLAKAFSLLNPQNRGEAENFLSILEDADAYTDFRIKEVIDRIYANRNANTWVREL